jgi:DNA-binding response OmpR family regulator
MVTDAAPRAPLTILLAEDDADLRSMLTIVLRRDGHRVVEFADGNALAAALAPRPEDPGRLLVIADMRLPELDGLTAIRTAQSRGNRAPFILITAFAEPRIRAAAAGLGAIAVLSKPFDFDDLRTKIRCFLEAVGSSTQGI